jgi:peptide/nickel transport system substrate-binding protein
MMKSYFRHFVLIMALVLFLVPTAIAQDNSITIAQGGDAASLDPQMQNDSRSKSVLNNIFDTLIYRAVDKSLEPNLATAWEAVDDTTWSITLRDDVTFHNGEAFDADDVKFSLERPLDSELGSPLSGRFSVIESVEVVDSVTVHVNTVNPYVLLPARLSEWYMVSKDYFEANDAETVATQPVGTGAYTFVEWVKDDHLTLSANADYWKGAPAIGEVTFRPIPETSTRVAALQSGDVDLITEVPAFRQEEFESMDAVEVRPVPSTYIQYIALDGTKNEALADVRVRQAIQYATNVPEIIEFLFDGSAAQISIPLANGTFGADASIEPYPYDLDKAMELLADAGYPDGISIELDAPVGRYAQDKEVAEALVGQWALAGIDVTLNINSWADQLTKYRDGDALAEAHFMGWGTSTFDADDILWGGFARQPTKNNYVNEEVTDLVGQARVSMDNDERAELYSDALAIIYEEVPWLFLFQQFDIYGVSSDVDWQPREDQIIEVFSMSRM